MNVLFLSTRSPYPLISGHSLRTYHVLKNVAQRHNVFLLTFIQLAEELAEENLSHLKSMCSAVHPFRIPSDISRVRLTASLSSNLLSKDPFVVQKYEAPGMRQKIRDIVGSESIDIVHVDMLYLSIYLDEFRHLPRVLTNHNVESMRLRRWFESEKNLLKKAYLGPQCAKLQRFEIASMNQYKCCIVVSQTDQHILQQLGVRCELFVVPNGTDTGYFKPGGNSPEKNTVVWIGHMDVHTNRDAVLHFWRNIYPILAKMHPTAKVAFVGTDPPSEIVKAAGNSRGNVSVTGFVDDIRPYLARAAVVIVPIRIGSGTRIKILDAMAMGKAIVSTSVGCEGLSVAHGENIVVADAPEDFASAVIRLLQDDRERVRIEEKARKLAKTYDWSSIGPQLEEVYRFASH